MLFHSKKMDLASRFRDNPGYSYNEGQEELEGGPALEISEGRWNLPKQ